MQSIDKDSDGKITVQELAALTGNSMKAFYKQEADRNMKELDANKDGQVTWDEYVKTAGSRGGKCGAILFRFSLFIFVVVLTVVDIDEKTAEQTFLFLK